MYVCMYVRHAQKKHAASFDIKYIIQEKLWYAYISQFVCFCIHQYRISNRGATST